MLSSGGLGVEGRGVWGVMDQRLMEAKQAAAHGPSIVQEAAFRGRTVRTSGRLTPSPNPLPPLYLNMHSKREGRGGGRFGGREKKSKPFPFSLLIRGRVGARVGRKLLCIS